MRLDRIDRSQLRADLVFVAAAIGPVGILLGLAGHDAPTLVLSVAVAAIGLVNLLASVSPAGARHARDGVSGYALGLLVIGAAVALGVGALMALGVAVAEAGLAALLVADVRGHRTAKTTG
jgi:hypothetical protein